MQVPLNSAGDEPMNWRSLDGNALASRFSWAEEFCRVHRQRVVHLDNVQAVEAAVGGIPDDNSRDRHFVALTKGLR